MDKAGCPGRTNLNLHTAIRHPMKTYTPTNRSVRHALASAFLLGSLLAVPLAAQESPPTAAPGIEDQLTDLRAAIARVEAALAQNHQGSAADSSADMQHDHGEHGSGSAMGGMNKKKGMGMMGMGGMSSGSDPSDSGGMQMGMGKMGMMNMGGMSSDGASSDSGGMSMGTGGMGMKKMGGMMDGMGMMMMGKMPDSSMATSSLPGFPGASHIYHIGSSDFFLDHGDHLALTTEQKKALNEIKSSTVLGRNEFDRQLERAEEQLWVLTSEASPDASAIEKALAEIGVLTADKRLDFIRAVGKAAEVLTDQQRGLLVGEAEADPDEKPQADPQDHQHTDQPAP